MANNGVSTSDAYREVLEDLFRLRRFGVKLDVMGPERALARMGSPTFGLPCVQIGGTNGKGSVAAMVESILRAGGRKTGLFTSPHLCRFTERIRVSGEEISREEVVRHYRRIRAEAPELTFFEVATAMAALAFAEHQVEIGVMEVGLGGRLDSTNVFETVVSGFCPIGLEHTAYLGRDLDRIAWEKGRMMRPGVPAASLAISPVVLAVHRAIAQVLGVPWHELGRDFALESTTSGLRPRSGITWSDQGDEAPGPRGARRANTAAYSTDEERSGPGWIGGLSDQVISDRGLRYRGPGGELEVDPPPLAGSHQRDNAALALALVGLLPEAQRPGDEARRRGISSVEWHGRMELLEIPPADARSPVDRPPGVSARVLLDAGHNPPAVEALTRALGEIPRRRTTLVVAAMLDKDISAILEQLLSVSDEAILTRVQYYRGASPEELLGRVPVALRSRCSLAASVPAALEEACRRASHPEDLILVAGSVFLVGEARAHLLGEATDPVKVTDPVATR